MQLACVFLAAVCAADSVPPDIAMSEGKDASPYAQPTVSHFQLAGTDRVVTCLYSWLNILPEPLRCKQGGERL